MIRNKKVISIIPVRKGSTGIKNKNLIQHLEENASISINGVSLTISKVSNKNIILNIIPHTLKLTNLKNLRLNDTVNVELDIFGKYIYKFTK